MEKVATIGLDIAKSVFQVHGVGADGEVVIRRRLTRARMLPFFAKLPHCLVGIEACNNHRPIWPPADSDQTGALTAPDEPAAGSPARQTAARQGTPLQASPACLPFAGTRRSLA